jgi:uncharacterized surface protein with fasciclin (FAS1) repeats
LTCSVWPVTYRAAGSTHLGSGGPQVNQANVACQGVRTSNGVVWLIDSVLLPQF